MNVFLNSFFINSTSKFMHQLACVKFTSFTYSDSYGELASTGNDVIGIVYEAVHPYKQGKLAVLGVVTRVDTSKYTAGTQLYCGSNGYLTDVPNGPSLATVLKQATDGVIYVNCVSSSTEDEIINTGTGSTDLTAPGIQNPNEIAFFSADNVLTTNPSIKINAAIKGFDMGIGKKSGWLDPIILLNNQSTPQLLLSYPVANNEDTVIVFSVVRDGERTVGEMVITATPTRAALMHRFGETSPLGIEFSVALNAGNVEIYYKTPNSGFNSNFRYRFEQWGGS